MYIKVGSLATVLLIGKISYCIASSYKLANLGSFQFQNIPTVKSMSENTSSVYLTEKGKENENYLITLLNNCWETLESINIYVEKNKKASEKCKNTDRNKKSKHIKLSSPKKLLEIISIFETLSIFIKKKEKKNKYMTAVMNMDLKEVKKFHINMVADLITEKIYSEADAKGENTYNYGYIIPSKSLKLNIEINSQSKNNLFEVIEEYKKVSKCGLSKVIEKLVLDYLKENREKEINTNPDPNNSEGLVFTNLDKVIVMLRGHYKNKDSFLSLEEENELSNMISSYSSRGGSSDDSNGFNSSDGFDSSNISSSEAAVESSSCCLIKNGIDDLDYVSIYGYNLLRVYMLKKSMQKDFYSDWVAQCISKPKKITYIPWSYFDVNVFFNTSEELDRNLLYAAHKIFYHVYSKRSFWYMAQNKEILENMAQNKDGMENLFLQYKNLKNSIKNIDCNFSKPLTLTFKAFVYNILKLLVKKEANLDMYMIYFSNFRKYINAVRKEIDRKRVESIVIKDKIELINIFASEYSRYNNGKYIFVKLLQAF